MKGGYRIGNIQVGGYIQYHVHTDYSLLDSCTNFQDYIDLAVQSGQRAIAFTEHGKPLGWISKKMACDKAGIRLIHGVEIYLTEQLEEKVRDNYHTILLAKNLEGVLELNRLVSKSCDKEHFYYVNRISFDEFLAISDNIIRTSACLASPLSKLPETHPMYTALVQKYDFLEVQPHLHPDQVEFNKKLFRLSAEFNKPLIAGTDTHSSSKYKSECRDVLLVAKHKSYGDEDAFDLTYKTYEELVDLFGRQGAMPEEAYMAAINNTNMLYEMTEDFELDVSIKYPLLYGSREVDASKLSDVVWAKLDEKLASGVIPPEQEEAFRQAINEELRVFNKLGMAGFMLSTSELVSWCREQGMAIGTARGSVGGSRVAYVADIIDLNPETWSTVFSRFCNEDRVEIGDIDIDCVEDDRPTIFNHITGRFGEDKTARVAAFGTIQAKKAIEDIGRCLEIRWKASHDDNSNNPYALTKVDAIKKEFASDEEGTKAKYPDLFYFFDGLIGTKASQSVHPAGMVISPITLDDNYGVFDKDNERCLMMDMDEAHEVGVAKYDFLVLKTVQVIRDACRAIGVPYPKTYEINWDDSDVWEDINKNPASIFQFESSFAADCLKKYNAKSIYDMSLVTACIRPSGASYRNELFARKPNSNPSELIDELLKDNNGYLIYQEDTIKFLQQICGLTGSEADNVRRAIGRKDVDRLNKALPQILEGYCAKSEKPRAEAEQEAKAFLQIIEDSAYYQFGYNHSIAYCLLGYLCGYYRYYYPHEFLTSYLNNAANEDDIVTGTKLAKTYGISVTLPKWGFSRSDYFYDKDKNIIAKGLASVKFMSAMLADELYSLSKECSYKYFMDLLRDLSEKTSLNSRQLDILIRIDFFSDFGNQSELLRMVELFIMFKKGEAKQVKKSEIDGTPLESIVKRYAVGVTKTGGVAKSYTLLDVMAILKDAELSVKEAKMEDLSNIIKMKNFHDVMGYAGYVSGKEEDRRVLYVSDIFPVRRKSDGKQFGYSVVTKSIGSGKDGRFTVFCGVYDKDPIKSGDIIFCKEFIRDGPYFRLTAYEKVMA
jgi:DNA polymerase-3 subunit alpha